MGWLPYLLTLLLLMVAFLGGGMLERRHFREIAARERGLRDMITASFEVLPAGRRVEQVALVMGNVVVSLDYFKRFLAGLRALFGGRIAAYEPLLDRARREAVLRMQEQARIRGFDAVVNVRLETARVANAFSDDGTAGVEILAFGTALRWQRADAPADAFSG